MAPESLPKPPKPSTEKSPPPSSKEEEEDKGFEEKVDPEDAAIKKLTATSKKKYQETLRRKYVPAPNSATDCDSEPTSSSSKRRKIFPKKKGTHSGSGSVIGVNNVKGKSPEKRVTDKDSTALKGEMDKEKNDEEVERRFWSKYPFLRASFESGLGNYSALGLSDEDIIMLVKRNLSLIGSEKVKNLDTEWKELILEKMELTHKMSALLRKQVKIAIG